MYIDLHGIYLHIFYECSLHNWYIIFVLSIYNKVWYIPGFVTFIWRIAINVELPPSSITINNSKMF